MHHVTVTTRDRYQKSVYVLHPHHAANPSYEYGLGVEVYHTEALR